MCFWLLMWFVTWRLAFCGRQLKYFHGLYLKSVSLFYVIVSLFSHWLSLRCFIVLGHFDWITTSFFGVVAASFFTCFVFVLWICTALDHKMLLGKLFLSVSLIASSHVCWGVYNCLKYNENLQVSLFYMCTKPCLLNLASEINKTLKLCSNLIFYIRGRQPFPSRRLKTLCKVWRGILIFHQQFRFLRCLRSC